MPSKSIRSVLLPVYCSAGSNPNRSTDCHDKLQRLFNEVIKHYDCSIITGCRSNEEQDELYKEGKSQCKGGQSKHNHSPSLAVDVAPYPIDWDDTKRFYHFVGVVKGIASQLGIKLRTGADWDDDNDLNDQSFFDLNHFELKDN